MRSVISLIFFSVFILIGSSAWAGKPINNLDGQVPPQLDGEPRGLEEVKTAVITACSKRGWMPVIVGPNDIEAEINVRDKHFAKVKIHFTPETYSIHYLDSKNLDYDSADQTIHRNYNKWVILLGRSISRGFSVQTQI